MNAANEPQPGRLIWDLALLSFLILYLELVVIRAPALWVVVARHGRPHGWPHPWAAAA
jgi:hypothetical protein